jgi:hypothetical protein
VTPATGEQRRKQQESQLGLLRQEIRKAREMGISREQIDALSAEEYRE